MCIRDSSFTIIQWIIMTLFVGYLFTKIKYFTVVKTQNNAVKLPFLLTKQPGWLATKLFYF